MLDADAEISHSRRFDTASESGAGWLPNYTAAQKRIAQDIAKSILEIRDRAKAAGLFPIMIPLEFAFYEASSAGNRVDVPREEADRLNRLASEARKAATENVASYYAGGRRKACL